jgi:hypothetical protein
MVGLMLVAYLALQYTQAALKDVHDGEVDAFPVVDDFVVVDAGDYEGRRVVFAGLFYALLLGLFGEPSFGFRGSLLSLGDEPQELDVAGRKQVPSSVDVDDSLPGLHSLALYELVELALLLLDGVLTAYGF